MTQIGTINELTVYPIKSCDGISVDKALVTKLGLALVDHPGVIDRKWMIIDGSNGSFLTQRQLPKMVFIKPRVEGDHMILSAQNMPDLKVPIATPNNKINCRVWKTHLCGYAYGGDVSKWLSKFLEKENLDLVNFGDDQDGINVAGLEDSKEAMNVKETDLVLFNDYTPYMFLSEASVNDLNTRLKDQSSVRNFRPTVYIKDCPAYSEDNWTNFKIRDVTFHNVKHCTRCLLTTVNPNIGEKDKNQEPLKTLKRQNVERYGVSPMFGINVATDEIGEKNIICLNDPIYSI